MIGIFPDTEVRLITGCPIEKSHANTIFFTSPTEQVEYFNRFRRRVFYNVSYQRENRNVFRIECPIADVIDCNYMMFKNSSFENKWFYAFIDKINYVNPNTSEVEYEIDVLQSWYFNFDFHQSFVEREHTISDIIGQNIISEPVEVSEYITKEMKVFRPWNTTQQKHYSVVICYVPNEWKALSYQITDIDEHTRELTFNVEYCGLNYSARKGEIYNNIYAGFNRLIVPIDNTSQTTRLNSKLAISAIIDQIVRAPESGVTPSSTVIHYLGGKIVDVYVIPQEFSYAHSETLTLFIPTTFDSLSITSSNSYKPKNNKLYCYPFQKLVISNNDGQEKTLHWENSGLYDGLRKPIIEMRFNFCELPLPFLRATPSPGYNGGVQPNIYGVTQDGCVSSTWSEDSYTRWYNVNKSKIGTSLTSDAIKLLTSAVLLGTGKYVTGGLTGVTAIADAVQIAGQISDKKRTPDELYGSATPDGLKMLDEQLTITMYSMQIKAEQAKIIDDFFTMYGYQVNELKIPNVFNPSVFSQLRPWWNYVKTQNAVITPKEGYGLPAEAEQKICEIFNKGITFWNKDAIVGNYSADNSPVI